MKKYFLSSVLLALVSVSFSQSTPQKIEQLKKDPKTSERAAKADAIIINKKNVTDSTSKIDVIKKKRKSCKSARKQKITSSK